MLLWIEQSDMHSVNARGETGLDSSTDLDKDPLSIDAYLNMEDLRLQILVL